MIHFFISNQDYPSPGEIRELLIDNNVIPVFAVTDEHQLYYSQLKSMIEITGAQVINIRSDSSDIITAINFAYEVNKYYNFVQFV